METYCFHFLFTQKTFVFQKALGEQKMETALGEHFGWTRSGNNMFPIFVHPAHLKKALGEQNMDTCCFHVCSPKAFWKSLWVNKTCKQLVSTSCSPKAVFFVQKALGEQKVETALGEHFGWTKNGHFRWTKSGNGFGLEPTLEFVAITLSTSCCADLLPEWMPPSFLYSCYKQFIRFGWTKWKRLWLRTYLRIRCNNPFHLLLCRPPTRMDAPLLPIQLL